MYIWYLIVSFSDQHKYILSLQKKASGEEEHELSEFDNVLIGYSKEFWNYLPWTIATIFVPFRFWDEITYITIGSIIIAKYGHP